MLAPGRTEMKLQGIGVSLILNTQVNNVGGITTIPH